MIEYSLLTVSILFCLAAIDAVTGVRLLRRSRFWLLLILLSVGTLVFDGYLTARPVISYNPRFLLGVRLWHIPVEDFGYCLIIVTTVILMWELLERVGDRRH